MSWPVAGVIVPVDQVDQAVWIRLTASVPERRRAGIVSGTRYYDKGEFLDDPPGPANPPDRPKAGRDQQATTSTNAKLEPSKGLLPYTQSRDHPTDDRCRTPTKHPDASSRQAARGCARDPG